MNRNDSLLIYVAVIAGTSFIAGMIGLMVVVNNPAESTTSVPATWTLAFILLLVGPLAGTAFGLYWWGGGGRGGR